MFDAYFGFRAPPFRLGPDPSFYFESSGHGKALAYLKYGVYQREGFIVVTGEIGSGKTTLVRKLLESLDPREVTAAQVVSTQLDSFELLRAVCTAFGVPVPGSSKALTLATLEAFFTALAAAGRRALAHRRRGSEPGPEGDGGAAHAVQLPARRPGPGAELPRRPARAPPHLTVELDGATAPAGDRLLPPRRHDRAETRGYIEHRLRHVGWQGIPFIDNEAFSKLHAHSGGIPRRINLLCTRALLACSLREGREITGADVVQAAAELAGELGPGDSSEVDRIMVRLGKAP